MSLLNREELEALVSDQNGLRVSVYMPTHPTGREIQQDPIRLKNALDEAEQQLLDAGLRKSEAQALLEAGHQLVKNDFFWQHQSDGLVLFLAQDMTRTYRLPLSFEKLVVVAHRFHIKPLVPLLSHDGQFYLLALNQDEAQLLLGSQYNIREIEEEEIPEDLADILHSEDFERHLQFHSSTQVPGVPQERPAHPAHPSQAEVAAERPGTFHGQGGGEMDFKAELLRDFHHLDDALSEFLAGEEIPLVLAGVDYLLPLYEEANSYPHLMEEGIEKDPQALNQEALHQAAWEILEPRFEKDLEEALGIYKHLAAEEGATTSVKIEKIVPAAYDSQVDTLFVPLDVQQWGKFDPETRTVEVHDVAQAKDEDLLDFAAAYTLLNGGTVYAVSPEDMPAKAPMAAVFRF